MAFSAEVTHLLQATVQVVSGFVPGVAGEMFLKTFVRHAHRVKFFGTYLLISVAVRKTNCTGIGRYVGKSVKNMC